jgi:hypothetical protein
MCFDPSGHSEADRRSVRKEGPLCGERGQLSLLEVGCVARDEATATAIAVAVIPGCRSENCRGHGGAVFSYASVAGTAEVVEAGNEDRLPRSLQLCL